MENPLGNKPYNDSLDEDLVARAVDGSKEALQALVIRHQLFIYNVVWKMVLNPQNAEDLTQDILVKVITRLHQFNHASRFRTWLYRIVVNHVLNCKKQFRERQFTSFDAVGDLIDSLPDQQATIPHLDHVSEDVRISCTAGMLLCLNREQRIVFVLGGIFNIDHNLGAEILEITPDNFRQRLTRARKDLHSFMDKKCGLVNKNNPCRCPKKTKAFIENGWTTPDQLQFNARVLADVYRSIPDRNDLLLDVFEEKYQRLFVHHPLQEPLHASQIVEELLGDNRIKDIFNLK